MARLVRARLLFGDLTRLVHLRASEPVRVRRRATSLHASRAQPRAFPRKLRESRETETEREGEGEAGREWAADSGGGERRRAVVGRVRAVVGQRAVSGGGGGGAGGRRSCATGLVRAARRHLGGISSGSWPRLANQPVDRLHVVLVLLCLPRAGGADARSDGRGCRKRSGGRGCRPRDLGAIYVAACMRVHSYPNQPQYLGTISTASRSNLGRNSISRMCECAINPQISAASRLHLGRISVTCHLGGISAASRPRLVNRSVWLHGVFGLLCLQCLRGRRGGKRGTLTGPAGQSRAMSAQSRHDRAAISARSPCDLGTVSARRNLGAILARSRHDLGAIPPAPIAQPLRQNVRGASRAEQRRMRRSQATAQQPPPASVTRSNRDWA